MTRRRPALDGAPVDEIYTDLTARRDSAGVDLTSVRRLPQNADGAFMGETKDGPFDVPVIGRARGSVCPRTRTAGRTQTVIGYRVGTSGKRRSAGRDVEGGGRWRRGCTELHRCR